MPSPTCNPCDGSEHGREIAYPRSAQRPFVPEKIAAYKRLAEPDNTTKNGHPGWPLFCSMASGLLRFLLVVLLAVNFLALVILRVLDAAGFLFGDLAVGARLVFHFLQTLLALL